MPFQVMSKVVASVTVCCEACGHQYTYEKEFKVYGSHADQLTARRMAMTNRDGVYDWQTKRLSAGNYSSMVQNLPCPQCGYVQSWMAEPLRRRKGWQWGGIAAAVTFLIAIPLAFLLNSAVRNTALGSPMAGLAFLLIFVLPLIVLFAVRAVVMKTFQANKNQAVPAQRNAPSVALYKL